MVLKGTTHDQNSYDALRRQADRERLNRRAGPAVQDGRYGFGQNGDLLEGNSSGLYSDEMMVDAPGHKNQNRRRQR